MRSQSLRAADIRPLLELTGELHAMPADATARRHHAMTRVGALLSARGSLFVQTATLDGRYRMFTPTMIGLEHMPSAMLSDYFDGELEVDPCAPAMERRSSGTVARRERLIDDRQWRMSRYVNEQRLPYGFDDGLYGRVDGPAGGVYGFCFLRGDRERGFGDRHEAIVELFVRHVAPLCLPDAPADRFTRLAPRHRPVAERLCAGDSIKEAAYKLGLSPHTVAEYVKQIHRTLAVSSRGEMLAALIGQES